jgi:electron transfer flavoprotein alpha subunit
MERDTITNILTFCAASAENLPSASLEVLAAARKLSDKLGKATVQSLLLGSGVEAHGETLVQHGADEVLLLSHPNLERHEGEVMLGVLEAAVHQTSPGVILFPHDDLGGQVAPRLAYRLGTGIVTDCTDFAVQDGTIRWLRPVYGGKAMAYMVASGPVQLATMRALAFESLPADPTRRGQVQAMEIDVTSISPRVPIVDHIVAEEEFEGLSLDQANIIVSGGRGMESKDNFATLRELANVLEAAVGGSRPAADLGWVPHSHLVGQTGKIVAPNLYIAVAISGAPQHMSGAGSAKTIVAVNKDEDAPIFKVANIGVVGEWQNVLPTMIEECKKIAGK